MRFHLGRWSVIAMLACSALPAWAAQPRESFDLRVPVAPMARAMQEGHELV